MEESRSSYRQIFKATSLFGGVQVFNILISIIRSKFIAVFLGPGGMGIAGLLTSTTGLITAVTNFGLGTSAVKNVSAAVGTNDEEKISVVITVLRKLVWVTGLLGMVITIIFSAWLSEITFGNNDYRFAFIWISVTLLFQQLSTGQMVVLQGLRKLQSLAKANLSGSVIGLLISVPVYYFWRINGIVPVIILSSLTSMLLSWYFASKHKVNSVPISREKMLQEGKEMLKMGFVLSLSGLMALGSSFLVRIYISNISGVEQVGLYNAGFAIITTYVGMVFTAMSTDYYPRLSAIANDKEGTNDLINQQGEVAILIIAPILSIFLIYINWIVVILYSQKFVAISDMILWAALGMYFKAATWSVGFILLAKGASKTFFWNELIGNIYILVLNVLGYKLGGLEGLGMSFLAAYLLYFIQILFVVKFKYEFKFNGCFFKVASIQMFIGLLCFMIMKILNAPMIFIFGTPLIIVSTLYSFWELEKRIGLKLIILEKINNFRNKL